MIKLLVHYRKNGTEYKRGSIMKNLSKTEEKDLIDKGFAEHADKEEEADKDEGTGKAHITQPNLEEPEEELNEAEEIEKELTLEDIQKMSVKELETLAKDNSIKLEGNNQKEKAE